MKEIEKKILQRKAEIFKALGHSTRLWIIEKLENGEACVCEFVEGINANYSTISAHLSVLQNAGLIESEKRGREIYYSSKIPCIYNFMACVENIIKTETEESMAILKMNFI